MSKHRPWFPFYPADYLADTRRLTTTEHGAYCLLLMEQWNNGSVPDDDVELARITGMRIDHWKKVSPKIRAFFGPGDKAGTLEQKRMHAERSRAMQIGSKRAGAARERWSNPSTVDPDLATTRGDANQLNWQESGDANASGLHPVCTTHLHPHPQAEDSASLREAAAAAADQSLPPVQEQATAEAGPASQDRDLLGDVPRPSARQTLFREGIEKLIAMTGRTERSLRSWLGGKVLPAVEDDAAFVLSQVQEAHRLWIGRDAELADPVSWISGQVRGRAEAMADGRVVRLNPAARNAAPGAAAAPPKPDGLDFLRAMAAGGSPARPGFGPNGKPPIDGSLAP